MLDFLPVGVHKLKLRSFQAKTACGFAIQAYYPQSEKAMAVDIIKIEIADGVIDNGTTFDCSYFNKRVTCRVCKAKLKDKDE